MKKIGFILCFFLLWGGCALGAGTPVVFYLKNLPGPRIGTDSDRDILRDLKKQGFLVEEVDCSRFPKQSPELEVALTEFHIESPKLLEKYEKQGVQIDYGTILYVPAGYRVACNIPVWNIVKYGPPHILDYVLEIYNTAVVKKFKVPKVQSVDQIISLEGRPLDYNLYIDFIYPSGKPKQKVPLLLNFSSNAPRFYPFSPKATREVAYRAIFPIGFLTSGYAFANLDHCFIPTSKRGVFGHTIPYSLDRYTGVAYITSAIRYIHSVADRYNLNGKIGSMGISKASFAAVLSARPDNASVAEERTAYGVPASNQPYPGYPSTVDVAYAAAGDGTRKLPNLLIEGSVPMVTSMGKRDKFKEHWGLYPKVLTHLNRTQIPFVALWMEELGHTYPGLGVDYTTGESRYSLLKRFFDFYLKPQEHQDPELFYILPRKGSENVRLDGTFRVLIPDELLPVNLYDVPKYCPITVRFLSKMKSDSAAKYLAVLEKESGRQVSGTWQASMHNTIYQFVPDTLLQPGIEYMVQVRQGMPAENGRLLSESVTRYFRCGME